jgi:hypothetical protein
VQDYRADTTQFLVAFSQEQLSVQQTLSPAEHRLLHLLRLRLLLERLRRNQGFPQPGTMATSVCLGSW